MALRGTGCSGLGSGAVGYWGRDIHRRILAEGELEKQRALLTEQILAGGLRMAVWRSVLSGTQCNCWNKANEQSDRKCVSCYGQRYVPGFYKFGYNTLWLSASDSGTQSVNLRRPEYKSSYIEISPGFTSGTLESVDFPFIRSAFGSVWEYEVSAVVREDGGQVVAEYSLDAGVTWFDISNLPTENPAAGSIRFRITLARETVSKVSPQFSILRARYATIPLSGLTNGEYRNGPWVLALKTNVYRQIKKQDIGDIPYYDSGNFWTVGLSTFDPNIQPGTREDIFEGPGFVEFLDGVFRVSNVTARRNLTSWRTSDPFGYIILSQDFTLRIADPVGPYALAW